MAVGLLGSLAVHGATLALLGTAHLTTVPPVIPVEIVELSAAGPAGSAPESRPVVDRPAAPRRAPARVPAPESPAPARPAPAEPEQVVVPERPAASAPEPPPVIEPPRPEVPPPPAVTAIAEAAPSPAPAPLALPAPAARTEPRDGQTARSAGENRWASVPRSDASALAPGDRPISGAPGAAVPAGVASGNGPAGAGPPGGSLVAPYLAFKRPRYPEAARRAGVEGTVLVKAYILADGSVRDAQVKRSGGHSALDRAALDTILESHFVPARRGGTPVAVWVEVPVDFKLRD